MDATEKTDIEAKNNDEQSDENVDQQTGDKEDSPEMEENPTDDKPDEIYDTIESPEEHEPTVAEDVPENDCPTPPVGIQAITERTYLEGNKDNDSVLAVELPAEKTDRISPEIVVESRFPERDFTSGKSVVQPIKVVTPREYYSPLPAKKQSLHVPEPPQKTSCCRKFRHCLLLTIFSVFVFGYAVGGAYLFSHLERVREMEYNAKIDKWKNDTAILLATELRQVTPHEGIWARKVFHHLEIFEKDLLKASAIGYRRYDHRDRGKIWTWTSSLYFSVALMTTSGYGPMAPRSEMGRTAAVVYSLFGIPLALSWLMVVGYILATFWASLFHNICCSLCHERLTQNVENPYPTVNHNHSRMKQQEFRKNSVVPVDEQKLIFRTKNQPRHPKNVCRTNYPPKSGNNYVRSNNHQVKPSTLDVPNSLDIIGGTGIEKGQIREMYYTMDYATAIVYAMVLFIIYFMFFSILFSLMEGWILTDVLYFSYLMFVTLGPGCHEMQDDGFEIRIKNNIFYTVHLCIGYCILSMIVNLIYMLIQNRRKKR